MAEMTMVDNSNDLDWVPAKLRGKKTAQKKGKIHLTCIMSAFRKGFDRCCCCMGCAQAKAASMS